MGLFFSCEDVVDIDVDDAQDLIVVDAWLNNLSEPQTIKITSSQNYFDSSFAEGITDATVLVRDDSGNSYSFDHIGAGLYNWTPATGENIGSIGQEFFLDITTNGQSLSAATTLGGVPPVDTITQELVEDEAFFDDGVRAEFFAQDIAGETNTYWIKTYRNDTLLSNPLEINIAYDAGPSAGAGLDGLVFIPPIRSLANPEDTSWQSGEEIRVEIHSISEEAFFFLELARDQMINGQNGIFAEPIANTTGNLFTSGTNEVLGIFNVAAISQKTEEIR